MKAALLPDRGVVKVVGDGARNFLNGLVTADLLKLKHGEARFCALLTPQGKIIADFLVGRGAGEERRRILPRCAARAAFRRCSRSSISTSSAPKSSSRICPKSSACWRPGTAPLRPPCSAGNSAKEAIGLSYTDPRLPALGLRVMLPPHRAASAAAELGAVLVDAADYEAHRIALGIPSGGLDFTYGDAFPHEADMDQLAGVDFAKGCYVGQEVVSRMEHRGTARTRAVPVRYRRRGAGAWRRYHRGRAPARHHGLRRRRPRRSRCCGSTASPMRSRTASR